MAPGGDQRVNELIPVFGRTLDRIARPAYRTEQPDGARRGIQPDRVPHPRVFGRVVGEQDSDLLLLVRGAPEAGRARREPGEAGGAFGVGPVERKRGADGRLFIEAFLEREGDPDDASVELRYRHLPGRIQRGETGVRGEPGLARGGRADALDHGDAELFEGRHFPLQPPLWGAGSKGVCRVGPPTCKNRGNETVYL